MSYNVSIIVPCYNQAQYLPETLDSVLAQTYQDWECIIVNDGSLDNTEEIAKKYCEIDDRYIYVYQENAGVSVARNNGISISKGDYIQFIDSDDVLESNKLDHQVDFLNENKQVDIIYSAARYFYEIENGKDFFAIHPNGIVPTIEMTFEDKNQKEILNLRNICTICSTLYRREVLDLVKFRSVIFEDWLFHFECSLLDFRFHFENFKDSKSLIRLTLDSQMIRHINRASNENSFENEFDNIVLKYKFKSKLEKIINNNFTKKGIHIKKYIFKHTATHCCEMY